MLTVCVVFIPHFAAIVFCFTHTVIVYKEVFLVVPLVRYSVAAEGNVSYCQVKEVVGKIGLFKAFYLNIGFWIKLLCNSARNAVKLHSVQLAVPHFFGHTAEKVSDAHSGFYQDLIFDTKEKAFSGVKIPKKA